MKTTGLEKLNVQATSSASCLAIFHFACWTTSVIVGSVAIWIRHQATTGVSQSVLGIAGVGLWGSLPYLVTGVLAVRAVKQRSFRAIKWFFVFSSLSLTCSVAILVFSSIAIAIEASVETIPKRVTKIAAVTLALPVPYSFSWVDCELGECVLLKHGHGEVWARNHNLAVERRDHYQCCYPGINGTCSYHFQLILASLLSGASTIEAIASLISCFTCYRAIGCCNRKAIEPYPFKHASGNIRCISRNGGGDEMAGHVTVMALPPRQAAELFYTMYRPFFPNVNGMFNVLNDMSVGATLGETNEFRETGISPDYRRSRRHSRRHAKIDPRDMDMRNGYRIDSTYEEDNSDEDADLSKSPHRHKRPHHDHHRWQQDELDLTNQIPNSGLYAQTRLTPLPEQDNERAEELEKEDPVANEESNDEEQQEAESPAAPAKTTTKQVKATKSHKI